MSSTQDFEVVFPNSDALTHPKNFKVTHPDQHLARRLRFPKPPTYEVLSYKVLSLWGSESITPATLGFMYVDSDGDKVVLSSDDELQAYYDEIRDKGAEKETVKMKVVLTYKQVNEDVEPEPTPDEAVALAGEAQPATPVVDRHQQDQETEETAPCEPSASTVAPSAPADTASTNIHFVPEPAADVTNSVEVKVEDPVEEAADPASPILPTPNLPTLAAADDDDPAETFPDALPTGGSAQPSLLADLSNLLGPAISTIVSRAVAGAYTPELINHVSKIEVELGNAQGEIGKSFEQAGFGMQELQVVIEGVKRSINGMRQELDEVRKENRARTAAFNASQTEADNSSLRSDNSSLRSRDTVVIVDGEVVEPKTEKTAAAAPPAASSPPASTAPPASVSKPSTPAAPFTSEAQAPGSFPGSWNFRSNAAPGPPPLFHGFPSLSSSEMPHRRQPWENRPFQEHFGRPPHHQHHHSSRPNPFRPAASSSAPTVPGAFPEMRQRQGGVDESGWAARKRRDESKYDQVVNTLNEMGFKESDVESVVRANLNLAEAEIVAIVCGGLFV